MRNEVSSGKNTGTLWTRDFTIITVGSVISMLGNSVSGFAMSLLVLDISQSTFLYAVYLAMYTLPQLVMPVIFGAVLDRFSRRKMIYMLDFLSSGLYLMMAIVLAGGWFSFPLFAVYCFVIGSIQSIYMVAYESFYPLLITEGFFQKAYSIASVLETFTAVMVPVSAFLYGKIGLAPLLAVNAVCFFLAAVMETQIRAQERYIEKQRSTLEEKVPYRRQILADIHNEEDAAAGLDGLTFDTVCEFIGFRVEDVERDYRLFKDKTRQYIYTSSASAYHKPSADYHITEGTALANPYWQYSRDKIACEEYLMKMYREEGFPVTIVRPSHTYCERSIPLGVHGKNGSWQVIRRERRNAIR